MTDTHRHEWDWWRRADGVYYHEDGIICTVCKTHIEDDDLIRRLSATECLSKTSALAACITARSGGDWVSEKDLMNYAKALEEA